MKKKLSSSAIESFRKEIYDYFKESGRHLPWRGTRDPYRILISEIMLQQTQVDRVVEKYKSFVKAYPDFRSLNSASVAQVYLHWQGLGYNRRALALKKIAQTIVEKYDGRLPDTVEELSSLPGIGRATASSICAFAFNQPVVFIETNIRTVFIHHFFRRRRSVDDSEIAPLAEKIMDRDAPGKWYSALMDYGTMLKQKYPNPSRKSAQYKKQSPFQGSKRQFRGIVLKILLENPRQTETSVFKKSGSADKEALHEIIGELMREGFIKNEKGKISIIH